MTLEAVLEHAVPAVAFLLMVAVGLDVTREDVRRIAAARRLLVAATLGQIVLLPAAAVIIVQLLTDARIADYVLLVAACPGGGMSNVYVYLARANTALSVTLTAASSLLALGSMPAVIGFYTLVLGRSVGFGLPVQTLFTQLLIMAVIPVVLGAFIRHRWPAIERKHGGHLRTLTAAGLFAIVVIGIAQSAGSLARMLVPGVIASTALVAAGLAAGWSVGRIFKSNAGDRFTLMIEFAVRSLAIAMVIQVGLLHDPGFVAFGAVAFFVQATVLMAAVRRYRTLSDDTRKQNAR